MKAKVINFLVVIKRIILVGATLWILSTLGKMEILRQKANAFSFACAKMLDLRLAGIEESMNKASSSFETSRKGSTSNAAAALKGLLTVSSYLDEAAWVAGSGRESLTFARQDGVIVQRSANSVPANSPLYQAHHKGKVVVSALEYTAKTIPTFRVSYPLDGPDGGFLLTQVNLWEFLKLPTQLAQDMLGNNFDFQIRDDQGKLLAHRVSPPDPIGKLATKFLVSRSSVKHLNMEVSLTPTRQALVDALKPGRLIWYCLGIAIVLCLLL